jgi:2Fe-2S iron-sulfur cluster binding domain
MLMANGRSLSVAGDATLLQAIRSARMDLPALCYFEGLPPYGACRLCTVTVTAPRHAVVAPCSYPVEDGLVVETDAPTNCASSADCARAYGDLVGAAAIGFIGCGQDRRCGRPTRAAYVELYGAARAMPILHHAAAA